MVLMVCTTQLPAWIQLGVGGPLHYLLDWLQLLLLLWLYVHQRPDQLLLLQQQHPQLPPPLLESSLQL